jgi:hypothetical protein
MDFVNAINGAKLRTKYFAHSNLPDGDLSRVGGGSHLSNSLTNLNYTYEKPQTLQNNAFLREMEMIKPISQQKLKKK